MTLLLERADVRGLLDVRTAIDVLERAFLEQANGHTRSLVPIMFHGGKARIREVAGALTESGSIGLRVSTGSSGTIAAVWDVNSHELLSIMSYQWGTVRTGATIGLATKYLAREDAQVVGMLGTGRNALSLLQGVECVRGIEQVKVYSRDAQHRKEFGERAGAALKAEVQVCDAPAEVVRGSDILVVSTDSRAPVFDPALVEPGLHVNSMGQSPELPAELYRGADLMVVGDLERERSRDLELEGTPPIMAQSGEDAFWARVRVLGEAVSGQVTRTDRSQITVFRDSSGGWGDVALARWVYERAREQGRGKEVTF
jgi:ornithine cyclodeaminase/alanine dehydrogenase-like protein (mu-crystallin family)